MEENGTPQGLCLSCGLCCDGSLFGRVTVDGTDAVFPLQLGGIEIQSAGSKDYFKQPCPAHRQGCCEVYADRPATCRKYRCELLKKYESGAIVWGEAQQRIARARMIKETIRVELARLFAEGNQMSAIALIPEEAKLAADPDLRKTWAPVLLRLAALFDCLQTHFQPPRKDGPQSNAP